MPTYLVKIVTGLLLILLLSACTQRINPAKPEQTRPSTTKTVSNGVLAKNFLLQVNQLRNKARNCGNKYFPVAPPLRLDDKLNFVALQHSMDMSGHNFLDHISSNGDTLVKRLLKADYAWRAIAENIAHNQRSTSEVLKDWLNSPGHCSNLMSPDYRFMGIAQVNWYWTQVFATPK